MPAAAWQRPAVHVASTVLAIAAAGAQALRSTVCTRRAAPANLVSWPPGPLTSPAAARCATCFALTASWCFSSSRSLRRGKSRQAAAWGMRGPRRLGRPACAGQAVQHQHTSWLEHAAHLAPATCRPRDVPSLLHVCTLCCLSNSTGDALAWTRRRSARAAWCETRRYIDRCGAGDAPGPPCPTAWAHLPLAAFLAAPLPTACPHRLAPQVIERVVGAWEGAGFACRGWRESPIKGAASGNTEFISYFVRRAGAAPAAADAGEAAAAAGDAPAAAEDAGTTETQQEAGGSTAAAPATGAAAAAGRRDARDGSL